MAKIDDITIGKEFYFRGGQFTIGHTNGSEYFISDYNKACEGRDSFVVGYFNDEPSCHEWLEENVGSTYKPQPSNC